MNTTHRKIKTSILPLFGLLIAFQISCSSNSKETDTNSPSESSKISDTLELTIDQFNESGLKIGKIELRSFQDVIHTTGFLNVPPDKKFAIHSFFSGYVNKIGAKVGEKVFKGQLLLSLENPEFLNLQQEFLEVKSKLDYLKADFDRQQLLALEQVTSTKNLSKAQSEYLMANVLYQSLGKKLKLMGINSSTLNANNLSSSIGVYSPANGFVTDLNLNLGTFLSTDMVAMNILNMDNLELTMNVFEKDLKFVHSGQMVTFNVGQSSDVSNIARVTLISKSMDESTRSIKVISKVENVSNLKSLASGMFVNAQILKSSESKWALPSEAIGVVDKKQFVLQVLSKSNQKVVLKRIELIPGSKSGNFLEVKNPELLNNKSDYIVSGVFQLM